MLANLWPGFVEAVDRDRREIRVSIPPLTDGASEWPLAEMCYPIGDDSDNTEIRVVEGKPIWIAFRAGDQRFPVIMGSRPVNVGNEVGTRRWNHDNIEHNADQKHTINAGQDVVIQAGTSITLMVGGTAFKLTADKIASLAQAHAIEGPVTQTGGDLTSDGVSVQNHEHPTAPPGPPSPPSKSN